MSALLEVEGLEVRYAQALRPTLQGLDLALQPGEVVVLLGDSGSGKSTFLSALLGFCPARATRWRWQGRECSGPFVARRGQGIGWIAQDPQAALHPMLSIRAQIMEGLGANAATQCADALRECGLPEHLAERYPHQLSGGERQRALLALCLARQPQVILADEPTSALDPLLAEELIQVLLRHVRQRGAALLWVTHERARIAHHADRLLHLQAGRWSAAPLVPPSTRPAAARSTPRATRLIARGLGVRRAEETRWALQDIDLELASGEIVAVVGVSGAGKSTLAWALAGHLPLAAGQIETHRSIGRARAVQLVFQDPQSSFNPRQRLIDALREAQPDEALWRASLPTIGLEALDLRRYPSEISGGERQRLAWVRAWAAQPQVLVYDEPLSALDLGNRLRMVQWFETLRAQGACAQLLVSHDLELVRELADRVLVLDAGRLVEVQPAADWFRAPHSELGRRLVAAFELAQNSAKRIP